MSTPPDTDARPLFADILPAGVVLVIADEEMQKTPLGEAEEHCIRQASDKRRAEFRGGRHAARQALRQLGHRGSEDILPAGDNRKPMWPRGYVGSITHTAGFCAAAVARCQSHPVLGIDAETRQPLKAALLSRICTAREIARMENARGSPEKVYRSKLLFCIKESIYKTFNPVHGVFLGFQEVDVELSPADNSFRADVLQTEQQISTRYSGRYLIDENFIFAATLAELS